MNIAPAETRELSSRKEETVKRLRARASSLGELAAKRELKPTIKLGKTEETKSVLSGKTKRERAVVTGWPVLRRRLIEPDAPANVEDVVLSTEGYLVVVGHDQNQSSFRGEDGFDTPADNGSRIMHMHLGEAVDARSLSPAELAKFPADKIDQGLSELSAVHKLQ